MRLHITIMVIGSILVATSQINAQARLTLFPDLSDPSLSGLVVDGGPNDNDGLVNDVIVVEDIQVPLRSGGMSPLKLSGEVRWNQQGMTGLSVEMTKLVITNATITNDSGSIFQIPMDDSIDIASKSHGGWGGANVMGNLSVTGEINQGDQISPFMSQEMIVSLFDSGVDYVSGPSRTTLDAKWLHGSGPPQGIISSTASSPGTTSTAPSMMVLSLSELLILDNETMSFPDSINGSIVVPEPSSGALLLLFLAGPLMLGLWNKTGRAQSN